MNNRAIVRPLAQLGPAGGSAIRDAARREVLAGRRLEVAVVIATLSAAPALASVVPTSRSSRRRPESQAGGSHEGRGIS